MASSNKRAREIERARYERQKARRAEHHGHHEATRSAWPSSRPASSTFAAIGGGYYLIAVHGDHGTSTAASRLRGAVRRAPARTPSTSALPTPTPTVFSGDHPGDVRLAVARHPRHEAVLQGADR